MHTPKHPGENHSDFDLTQPFDMPTRPAGLDDFISSEEVDLGELSEEELARQALEAPGADGDPQTPE